MMYKNPLKASYLPFIGDIFVSYLPFSGGIFLVITHVEVVFLL